MTMISQYFISLYDSLQIDEKFKSLDFISKEDMDNWHNFENFQNSNIIIPKILISQIFKTISCIDSPTIRDLGKLNQISKLKRCEDEELKTKLFFRVHSVSLYTFLKAKISTEKKSLSNLKVLEKITKFLPFELKLNLLELISEEFLKLEDYKAVDNIMSLSILDTIYLDSIDKNQTLLSDFKIKIFFDIINTALKNNNAKIAEKYIRKFISNNGIDKAMEYLNKYIDIAKAKELNILFLPDLKKRIRKKTTSIPIELYNTLQSINELLVSNPGKAYIFLRDFLFYNTRPGVINEISQYLDTKLIIQHNFFPEIWPKKTDETNELTGTESTSLEISTSSCSTSESD